MGDPGQRAENARWAAFETTGNRSIPGEEADQADQVITSPIPVDIRLGRAQAAAENQLSKEAWVANFDLGGQRARAPENPALAAVVNRQLSLVEALQAAPDQAPSHAVDQTQLRPGRCGGARNSVRHGC
jgi:hypothetical protein